MSRPLTDQEVLDALADGEWCRLATLSLRVGKNSNEMLMVLGGLQKQGLVESRHRNEEWRLSAS
jgi:DNA-binding IclR family transcriptional regulator